MHQVAIEQEVDARTRRYAPTDLPALLRGVQHVISIRGTKIAQFSPCAFRPVPAQELYSALIGPTGNLRAPSLKIGNTLLVGFNPQTYQQILANNRQPQ